ncbi:uncharacterized protein LOC110973031 isoform X2 [Acanthaster planci]|uniref:Uncharacterized protein LOC110973031 isoform X2 n=1 Tax=Acanthaster planci TaxID=133434 RepID=A0A8B7XFU5_ACAPL|nr:uncharacterized protein LOC110973031 isoform X2 [Acanthaster planci]
MMDHGDFYYNLPSDDSASDSLLMKLWDKESGRSSSLGLQNLVEDKDVAAKAVALVVNSSRKGVVSLCADVASILRAKKKLEHTLELQHKELLRLRRNRQLSGSASNRTSRSTSPTPPSFRSYGFSSSLSLCHNSSHKVHTSSSHSSSRCSQCSSLSSSPKVERALDQSTASSGSHDSGTHQHSSTELLPNQYLVTAEVHQTPPSECSIEDDHVFEDILTVRKNVDTFSREVQCSSLSEEKQELERKYHEVCNERTRLEEDLHKARQEVIDLRNQLCISEALHEESKICDLRIENELHGSWLDASKDITDNQSENCINLPALSPTEHLRRHSNPKASLASSSVPTSVSPHPPSQPRTQSPPHPPSPHFLAGCLCTPCQKLQQEGARQVLPSQGYTMMRGLNHSFTIHLDDHVATKGDRTGLIRYIGHLDNANSTQAVYVGLELDAPVGRHDGFTHGKRYFWCHRNHGLFVPVQDIAAIIKKPVKRPKTVDPSRRHGSANHSLKHPPRSHAVEVKHNKSGSHTSSGKRLLSADSTSLKQNRVLPTPSVT